MHWRSELVSVEKLSDELCVGVKGQSNWEIARTPRNVFRNSLVLGQPQVELPIERGWDLPYQPLTNSEWRFAAYGSEARGAKVTGREGNNPDRRLRSPSVGSVGETRSGR
jgi:hypothetical protein